MLYLQQSGFRVQLAQVMLLRRRRGRPTAPSPVGQPARSADGSGGGELISRILLLMPWEKGGGRRMGLDLPRSQMSSQT